LPAVFQQEKAGASEKRSLDEALEALAVTEAAMPKLLKRVRAFMPLEEGADVLDVGAAQGGYVTAFIKAGFKARGVEPWEPAIATSRDLARTTGIETDIVHGWAEELPYEDQSFDFVTAMSVMEHVKDPQQVFREVNRVLRPGGGFYFYTGSNLSYRQVEIKGFPLFPWYPDPVRRRIMDWAVEKRPSLVGHTEMPAYNWFSPWKTERWLRDAGFSRAIDVFDFIQDEELSGARLTAVKAARRNTAARVLGYVVNGTLAYLAIK
jgi:SAM-dependent methyltransferase